MSQPPYGDPNQPRQPDEPYAYPPPVDPFATAPQPIITPRTPAEPQQPPAPQQPAAQPPQPPMPPQPGFPAQPPTPPQPGFPAQPPTAPPGYPPPNYQQGYPTATFPTAPQGFGPNLGQPPVPPPPPAKKSRGLMIAAIVLGVAVLLCGGGGTAAYLLLRNSGGQGAADPKAAVQTFLTAVYNEGSVDRANRVVCADSRNKDAITKKINDVKAAATKHKDVKYVWPEPTVTEQKADRATVTTTVRMTTGDEKLSELALTFTVVKETDWFVCEVQAAS